jgi:hypothetical protein
MTALTPSFDRNLTCGIASLSISSPSGSLAIPPPVTPSMDSSALSSTPDEKPSLPLAEAMATASGIVRKERAEEKAPKGASPASAAASSFTPSEEYSLDFAIRVLKDGEDPTAEQEASFYGLKATTLSPLVSNFRVFLEKISEILSDKGVKARELVEKLDSALDKHERALFNTLANDLEFVIQKSEIGAVANSNFADSLPLALKALIAEKVDIKQLTKDVKNISPFFLVKLDAQDKMKAFINTIQVGLKDFSADELEVFKTLVADLKKGEAIHDKFQAAPLAKQAEASFVGEGGQFSETYQADKFVTQVEVFLAQRRLAEEAQAFLAVFRKVSQKSRVIIAKLAEFLSRIEGAHARCFLLKSLEPHITAAIDQAKV